jgi:carnitine O-acetyltransferase
MERLQYVHSSVFPNNLSAIFFQVTLVDQVLKALKDPTFDHGPASPKSVLIPTPLDFNISPQTVTAITKATDAAFNLVDSQALSFHLTSYGKAAIKNFGFSPDSWAQMIIQVAYGRLLKSLGQKRNGGTYESASTRKFYKGRTEVIRVVSSESDAFVQSMLGSPGSVSVLEKQRLLREAAKAHITTAKNAGSGQGIDKHLMGLEKVLRGDEIGTVELFDDVVYKRSSNWVPSTSTVFCEGFRAYGWGVPEGFGVAYVAGFDGTLLILPSISR